jgi:glycosyltransferase involved in cell wall biosynthesis
MADENIAVHVTHEAAGKIGGIGAVLQGFFTCPSYLEAVQRSILISPLFTTEGPAESRLGEGGEVLYSSIDGLINPGYSTAFRRIESLYNVGIVYGRRTFLDEDTGVRSTPEVLLIDVRYMDIGMLNDFKRRLFAEFGVQSHLHEHLWEYEQYIRLAPPAIAALKALRMAEGRTTIIAHEFMGMPTALGAILEPYCNFRTVFYAHEVATVRRIVEEHPGHDTMFYNVMQQAHRDRLCVNEVFGNQHTYFKHALVEAAKYCDRIYAVGDYVADELRFLSSDFESADIDIIYNGVPAYEITRGQKQAAKEKLQHYCQSLLDFRPDYVFTHVTRLVRSKGLWRDLRVLHEIEKSLRAQGKTAVFLLLSTEVSRRRSCDISTMEANYGWPVAHREGWPDLSGGEADFYTAIQQFNARSHNIKAIFINQFGFDPRSCGRQMPDNMEFLDIRKGTDVEFGQSIYEPFGIAQFEPLTFGGICVVSNVCGCTGFLRDVTAGREVRNVIIANYTNLGEHQYADIEDLQQINRKVRDHIEAVEGARVAQEILDRLPRNDAELESLIHEGHQLAHNMSWDIVVRKYLLNGLAQIVQPQPEPRDYLKAS